MTNLEDVAAERALLAGICQYGKDAYLDCRDVVNENCFNHTNTLIYAALRNALDKNLDLQVDLPTILSSAKDLGLQEELSTHLKYITSLFNFRVEPSNVRTFAKKIRRLCETKELIGMLDEAASNLRKVTGDEGIADICAIAERPLFDMTTRMIGGDNQVERFGEGLPEYVEQIINNPRESNGIPIPFERYAEAVGGIKAGIHLISARSGVGKSTHALNIGLFVAAKHNIPVIYLDSELFKEGGNWDRALARVSGVEFAKINNRRLNDMEQRKVRKAAKIIYAAPIDFLSIAAMDFDSVMSLVRKWIIQKVDFDVKDVFTNALLIYDYIKLTDYSELKNAREYELIGHRMSQIHDMTIKNKLPVIAYVQQNRQMEVSQSDRCNWFATSVASLEKKNEEEWAEARQLGSLKLYIKKSRWGEGFAEHNNINYILNGKISTVTETITRDEHYQQEKNKKNNI